MREDIRFYCGVGEKNFNHHPVYTGPYACVSPVCGSKKKAVNGVSVPAGALVLQDSGAFSDACLTLAAGARDIFAIKHARLSFKEALKRQEAHAVRFGYADQIEARASYDVLIDETWSEDEQGHIVRVKKRWSEGDADEAVNMTVAAGAYLDKHRNGLPCVMSAQGVTPSQYLSCVQRIMPHIRPDAGDIFGLGGFCILGRVRSLIPAYEETMNKVIPFLGKEGVKRVHLWGVCDAQALGSLLYLCDQYAIQLSTDSVGPTTRPVKENVKGTGLAVWGYASWRDATYPAPPILESCKQLDIFGEKAPTCGAGTRCRGLERARHVQATREWLAQFRAREPHYYRSIEQPAPAFHQMALFEEVAHATDIA